MQLKFLENVNDCSETYPLSLSNDLVNGCLDHLAMFRNVVVLYEGLESLTDHMLLLSVISVDDVLVF